MDKYGALEVYETSSGELSVEPVTNEKLEKTAESKKLVTDESKIKKAVEELAVT